MTYKLLFLTFLITGALMGKEQKIEWRPNAQITMDDFKPSRFKISENAASLFLSSGVMVDFAIQMSNIEFMFTKNFNSKVTCTFDQEVATLMAPDSLTANQLLQLVQFDFDLSELYTRKIRRELFENKKTFSDVTFFQPYFNKMNSERNKRSTEIYNSTDFGKNASLLEEEHKTVVQEISLLSDYCKECKPKKIKQN